MAELKDRLKQLRKEQHLTQSALGKQLHHGSTSITQYESGKSVPSISDIKKIAAIFNVSIDYLLGANDIRSPYLASSEDLKKWEQINTHYASLDAESIEELILYTQWLIKQHKTHT